MKRIAVITILLLTIFTNKILAQGGLDVSVLPMDLIYKFDKNGRSSLYSGVAQGISIGSFQWVNSNAMLSYAFQYTSLENEFKYFDTYFDNKEPLETYKQSSKTFVVKVTSTKVFNDIDFKHHFYMKLSNSFGVRVDKVDFVSKTSGVKNPSENYFEPKLEIPVGFIYSFDFGGGYQYNFTPWLGVYGDVSAGLRIFELIPYATVNIGTRIRFYR